MALFLLMHRKLMLKKIAAIGVAVLIALAILDGANDPSVPIWQTDPALHHPVGSGQGLGGGGAGLSDAALNKNGAIEEPLDPGSFVNGALLRSSAGDDRHAEPIMKHALRLDPRSTAAGAWLFNLYLREERFEEAVNQASVLYKLDPSLGAPLSNTLAILSQLADVRSLIIKRFNNTPFLDSILGSIPAGQLGEEALFEFAAAAEPRARVDTQTRIIADLLGRGDYDATSRALRSFHHSSGLAGNLIHDGSFTGIKGPQPFSWSYVADAAVRAVVEAAGAPGSPAALHVERFSPASVVAARQSILVRAGKYRLSHLLKAGDQGPPVGGDPPFMWSISCPGLPKPALASLPIRAGQSPRWVAASWTFAVPANCRLIELALSSTAADYTSEADLLITRVRLDPTGQ